MQDLVDVQSPPLDALVRRRGRGAEGKPWAHQGHVMAILYRAVQTVATWMAHESDLHNMHRIRFALNQSIRTIVVAGFALAACL
jgi:hypothetical protein